MKSLNKFSKILVLALTILFAISCNVKDSLDYYSTIVTFKLYDNDDGSGVPKTLYYNNSSQSKAWYKSSDIQDKNKIEEIDSSWIPSKEYSVTYFNDDGKRIANLDSSIEYKFDGYNVYGYGKITDDKGKINEDFAIRSNRNGKTLSVYAEWISPSDFALPTEADLINNVGEKSGYHFVGWSKTKKGNPLAEDTNADELTSNARNNKVVLYALYEEDRVFSLSLDLSGKGDENDKIRVYYNNKKDQWQLDSDDINSSNVITDLTIADVPEKRYNVTFDARGGYFGNDTNLLIKKLEYVYSTETDAIKYIDKENNDTINEKYITVENSKYKLNNTLKLTSDVDATPTFTGGVKDFPSDESVHYSQHFFEGWSDKQNVDTETQTKLIKKNDDYDYYQDVTFYAVWKDVNFFQITINNIAVTSNDYESVEHSNIIYYLPQTSVPGEMGFYKEDKTTKLVDNFFKNYVPTRTHQVSYARNSFAYYNYTRDVVTTYDDKINKKYTGDATKTRVFFDFDGYIEQHKKGSEDEEDVYYVKVNDLNDENQFKFIKLPDKDVILNPKFTLINNFVLPQEEDIEAFPGDGAKPYPEQEGYVFSGWGLSEHSSPSSLKGRVTDEVKKDDIFYSFWTEQKDTLYSITLENTDATDNKDNPSQFYYNESKKRYQENKLKSSPIINRDTYKVKPLPKREYTITLDANGGYFDDGSNSKTMELKSLYTFRGYYDEENTQIVNNEGKIVPDFVDDNVIGYARWTSPTTNIDLTPYTKMLKKSLSGAMLYLATKDDEGNYHEIENVSSYQATKSETIYAVWKDLEYYTVTLDNTEATNGSESLIDKLYYLPSSSIGDDIGYYLEKNNKDTKITSLDTSKVPYKVYSVIYNNTKDQNVDPSKYAYTFNGYFYTDVNNVKTKYIDNKGNTIIGPTGNITLKAEFSEPNEPITLPILTSQASNLVFKGWSKDKDGKEKIEDTVYRPTKQRDNIYAIWNNVYALKLNQGSATSVVGPSVIYYNETVGKWTSDPSGEIDISSIEKPERAYVITLNANGGYFDGEQATTTIKSNYKFDGYKNDRTTYINSDGNIESVALNKDIEAEAIFIDGNIQFQTPRENSNGKKIFQGWAETPDATEPTISIKDNQYLPTSDIELYAVWKDNPGYVVTLKHQNGTEDSKYLYIPDTNKWYYASDVELKGEITNPNFTPNTKKVWTLKYDLNGAIGASISDKTVEFTFGGYSLNGSPSDNYIGDDGKLVSSKVIDKDIELIAVWSIPNNGNTFMLPSSAGTKENSIFKGWSTKQNDTVQEYDKGSRYTIMGVDDVTLYAIWHEVYSLTLQKGSANTQSTIQTIYYNKTRNLWTSDSNGDTQIISIKDDINKLPERNYTLVLNANGGQFNEIATVKNVQGTYSFESFVNSENANEVYINSDGTINENKSIESNTSAIPTFTFNSVNLSSDGFSRVDYILVGWSTKQDSIEKEYDLNATYTPTSEESLTLYAVWKKEDITFFVLTLLDESKSEDGKDGTILKTAYFNSKYKYWTSDPNDETGESKIDHSKPFITSYPQKIITLTFDANEGYFEGGSSGVSTSTKEVNIPAIFNGFFYDTTQYIDKDGKLLNIQPSGSVKATISYVASEVSKSDFPNDNELIRPFRIFSGTWSTSKDGTEHIEEGFAPKKNTTVYAVWNNAKYYKITLNNNGSTSKNLIPAIYYLYESSNIISDRGYYENDNNNSESTKLNHITIPEKIWKVSYENQIKNIEPSYYNFTFNGYKDRETLYINADGTLNGVMPNGDTTIEAQFAQNGEGVTLPDEASVGSADYFIFKGWYYKDEKGKNINLEAKYYMPQKENDIVYALWFNIIKFTFASSDSHENVSDITTLYFNRTTLEWSTDNLGEKVIDKFPESSLPSMDFVLTIYNGGGKFDEGYLQRVITGVFEFEGYYYDKYNQTTGGRYEHTCLVDKGGLFDNKNASAFTEDTTIKSSYITWTFDLSQITNLHKENFTIIGWAYVPNASSSKFNAGIKFTPEENNKHNVGLYPVWGQVDAFSVTIDHDNGHDDDKVYYYVPSSKMWYKDLTFATEILGFDLPTKNKEWQLSYDANGAENASLPIVKRQLVFGGYSLETNKKDVYADIQGNILKTPESPIKLKAIWNVPESENTVEVIGGESAGTIKDCAFKGWSRNSLATKAEYVGGSIYTIESSDNVTLYAVWHKVYTVTLSQDEATTKTCSEIYFNATTSQWTSDANGSNVISSISIPRRVHTVTFDANGGYFGSSESETQKTTTSTYTFSMFSNGDTTIVDNTGKIVIASIDSSITANASWTNGDVTFPSTQLLHKSFNLFSGSWSKDPENDNAIETPYFPSADITLYAIWTSVNYYTITLNHNGATSNEYKQSRIYYLPTSSVLTDIGYYSLNNDATESKITTFASYIPKKEWIVHYDTNGGSVESINPSSYSFTFNGYKNDSTTFINANGTFSATRPTSDITIIADFTKPSSGITLPTSVGTKEKGVFRGWSETNNVTATVIKGQYHPEVEDTTLFAIWNIIYTLTLEKGDASTSSSVTKIYYNSSLSKWTSDNKGENELTTAITKPQRTYKVILNANGGKFGESDTKELLGTYTFLNYRDKDDSTLVYINSSALVNKEISISEDKVAVPTFSIEAIKLEDSDIILENFDLIGWTTSSKKDAPKEIDAGATYKPSSDVSSITLYAVWKKATGVMVTLKHLNNKDADSIYYYSPNSKKWYTDDELSKEVPNPTNPTFKPLNNKKWTLTYDTVGGEGVTLNPVVKDLEFSGYSIDGTEVEGNTYINSNGNVVKVPTKAITLSAIWKIPKTNNTITVAASAGTKTRSIFVGWGLKKDDKTIDYAPSSVYTMNTTENVTLYAVWHVIYVLTIEKGDADIEPSVSVLYFSTSTNKWSTDEKGENIIDTDVYKLAIPTRSLDVVFDANGGTIDTQEKITRKYPFTFDGYKKDSNVIINKEGGIEGIINSDCTVSPTWTIKPITIPQLNVVNTVKNKVFFGWTNIGKDSLVVTHKAGDDYTPTDEDNNFYAVWNDVYTLTLDSSSADTPLSTTEIFYNATAKKWSTVRDDVNEITTISGVSSLKKTIIVYNSGNGTTFKSDNALIHENERVIATYKSFNDLATGNECIAKDGKIVISEISSDVKTNIDYDVPMTSKAFPSASALNEYPGKIFKGWAPHSEATEEECITKYRPNPYIENIIYAVWGLPKYYSIKFDLDGGMYLDWNTFSDWVERGVKDNNTTMQNVKNKNPDYSNGTWKAGFEALKPIVQEAYYDPITDLYYLDKDLTTSLLGYDRTDKKFRTDLSATATRPVKKMKIEVDWQGFDIGKNPTYYEDYYLLNKWEGLDKDANYFNTGTDNYTLTLNTTTVPGGVYAYSKSYYTSSSQQVKKTVPPDQDMTMKAVYAGPVRKSEISFLNKTYDSESGTLLGFSTSQSKDNMIDDDFTFEPGKTYKLYAIWQPEKTGEITYYTKDFYRYFYNEERKGIEIKGINFFDSGYAGQDEIRDKLRATEKLIIPETLSLPNGEEYPVVAISEKASANGFSGESKNFPTRYEYSGLMKLKEIVFPKSLKYIGDYAFTDCSPTDWSRLQFTFDGTSIEYIGYMAFAMISSNNRSVTADDVNLGMRLVLPKTLKTLGEAAFAGRDIKSITFEEGSVLKSIPRNCFSNVRYMYYDKKYATEAKTFTLQLPDGDALRIPDSVESIGIEAFAFSRITSLEFGENSSLKTLGDGVWKGCSALKTVVLPKSLTSLGPDVPMYRRVSQFDNGQKWEPGYSSPKLSRPDGLGVTDVIDPEVDDEKQDYSDAIYTKGFPITASNTNGIYHTAAVFANGMFAYCTSLTSVTFRTGSTISLIPPNTFAFTAISSLDSLPSTVRTIGEYAYYNVKASTITIPSQIVRIEKGAFIANTATTIDLSNATSLKYIGKEAFYKSSKLATLVMPKSFGGATSTQGEYIFANSKKLSSVTYDSASTITSIPTGFFRGCSAITDISKAINTKIQELHSESFMNTGITSLDISKTKLVYIGNKAFIGNSITSLYLANGALNFIGDEAFKNVGATSLTLPVTLKSLGSKAFQGINVTELDVPYNANLTSIGDEVFSECKLLTSVTYNLQTISKGMFKNCEKLSTFTPKRKVTSIGNDAFTGTLVILPLS